MLTAGAWGLAADNVGRGTGDGVASGVPHSPQNLKRGGVSAPQPGQRRWRAVPHSPQNFTPSGFSNPQLAHRMLPLYSFGLPRARKTPPLANESVRARPAPKWQWSRGEDQRSLKIPSVLLMAVGCADDNARHWLVPPWQCMRRSTVKGRPPPPR